MLRLLGCIDQCYQPVPPTIEAMIVTLRRIN